MPKQYSVNIYTLENNMSLIIKCKDNGRVLFDMVCNALGIREVWFFGLAFLDEHNISSWLHLDKRILDQCVCKSSVLEFSFRVKFYPEDVAEELIQEKTRQYFYLQVKKMILSGDIYCPPEAAILLASYSVQAKYGDYDPKSYNPGFLRNEILIPEKVKCQFHMSLDMWEDRIVAWYSQRRGLLRDESELEYLKIAQDLEMYGISYFIIKNKRGTELWLGVDSLGLNIYEYDDKISPKIAFPWNEIRNISFKDKKFTIRPIDKNSPDFTFFAYCVQINKQILNICIGNHEQFIRRRDIDSIELQQMKIQAKEERAQKQFEKEQLIREKEGRIMVEKEKVDLEQQILHYKKEADNAKVALKSQQVFRESLIEKLHKKDQENEKVRKLSQEIKDAYCINEAVITPNDPLKNHNPPSKTMVDLSTEIDLDSSTEQMVSYDNIPKKLLGQLYTDNTELDNRSPIPHMDFGQDYDNNYFCKDYSNIDLIDTKEKVSISQFKNDMKINQKVYTVKSLYLYQQMNLLRDQIESLKVKERMSSSDIKHEENLEYGRTKYLTLNKVQQGTTKSRIAFFEEL